MKLFFSLFFILSFNNSFSQQESADSLYPLVIYYEGSNFNIDSNYRYRLTDLVQYMNTKPEISLHVRGHVCCGPDKKLSKKRAKKAFQYLKKNGIHKSRLSYAGYSNDLPLRFPEKTKEDAEMNRRVDFVIRR